MGKYRKYYGGPGTGKTTALIKEISRAKDAGKTITYVTFSRAMAAEARKRTGISMKFGEERAVAGTIHSIYSQIMGFSDYLPEKEIIAFFESRGIEFNRQDIPSRDQLLSPTGHSVGGGIMGEFDGHRHAYREMIPVKGYYGDIDGLFDDYELMKKGRMDYTDILIRAKESGASPESDVFIVDEYQDLTPLTRDVTMAAEKDASEVIIAGDDDQSIYGFMGANPSLMLEHPGEEIILSKSYRCKENILSAALSQLQIIPENKRKEKHLHGIPGGNVERSISLFAALDSALRQEGTMYILARTNKIARDTAGTLISRGVAFSYINYKHRYITPWTPKTVSISNALADFAEGREPSPEDGKKLMKAIPASLLIYGRKTKYLNRAKTGKKVPSMLASFKRTLTAQELLGSLNPNEITKNGIVAIGRRGIKKLGALKVFLDTKHASKGKEADTVVSIQRVPSFMVERMHIDPEFRYEEARLEYVARSRARESLYIV